MQLAVGDSRTPFGDHGFSDSAGIDVGVKLDGVRLNSSSAESRHVAAGSSGVQGSEAQSELPPPTPNLEAAHQPASLRPTQVTVTPVPPPTRVLAARKQEGSVEALLHGLYMLKLKGSTAGSIPASCSDAVADAIRADTFAPLRQYSRASLTQQTSTFARLAQSIQRIDRLDVEHMSLSAATNWAYFDIGKAYAAFGKVSSSSSHAGEPAGCRPEPMALLRQCAHTCTKRVLTPCEPGQSTDSLDHCIAGKCV